jgi:hypothetical protein
MDRKEHKILADCAYALGEAMLNTECAMLSEERRIIKEQFAEDYVFFNDLKEQVDSLLNDLSVLIETEKKGLKGGVSGE